MQHSQSLPPDYVSPRSTGRGRRWPMASSWWTRSPPACLPCSCHAQMRRPSQHGALPGGARCNTSQWDIAADVSLSLRPSPKWPYLASWYMCQCTLLMRTDIAGSPGPCADARAAAAPPPPTARATRPTLAESATRLAPYSAGRRRRWPMASSWWTRSRAAC